ncbi:MAG TPA: cytochrome c [Burkholderiales bacterium]|jgi:cytochrome c553
MTKTLSLLAAVAALAFTTSAYAGGDAVRGKQKAEQVCAACHATNGDWKKPLQPEYPTLAGQHADYIITALNEYKRGDKSMIGRKNPIMAGQAASLTATEIQDLAAFFSELEGNLHVKR